ncbi:MAG: PHP domain-containing protein [Actinobacteria bacterium]|nr:PHP domain-containing protein [Actinomycetota bacterium]
MVIDLHTHSTASDGTDTPEQLVQAAAAAGVDVLAITDHDTTAGWDPAEAALPAGLTLVQGTEFSCAWFGPNRRIGLHLLGYLYDRDDAELREARARLRESRLHRGEAIVNNLIGAGYPITWEQVTDISAGGAVGRPHIGRALVESGVVPDVGAAFADLLSPFSPYYVRNYDQDVFDMIRLVRNAGGVTVFAHPRARRRGQVVADEVIAEMAAVGLDGLEIDHPDLAPEDRADLRVLADQFDLVRTGSSDYHGTNKPIRLAAETTTHDQYEALLSRRNTAVAPIVLTT